MKPSRHLLIISWVVAVSALFLVWLVHEGFLALLIALLFLRPDLQDRRHTEALVARYRWLVNLCGVYAVVASMAILAATLLNDKGLGSALGVRSIFILFWPLIILVCLYERELFINANPGRT